MEAAREHSVFVFQSPLLAECHVTSVNTPLDAVPYHLYAGDWYTRWELALPNTWCVHRLKLTQHVVVQSSLLEGFSEEKL